MSTESTITEEPAPAEIGPENQPPQQQNSPAVEQATDEHISIPEPAGEVIETGRADKGADEPPKPDVERKLSRAERQTYDRVVRRFQVCGRCSYLLADFRLALGEEALQAAILNDIKDGWLELSGPDTLRLLLVRAFGIGPDIYFEQYDGLCPECRRRVVFSARPGGVVQVKILV